MSYSNPQYFRKDLKVQRSTAGKFVILPTTNGINQTGAVSLYWASVSPLSNKNFMDNFRLSLDIQVDATATAATDTYYFVKNIMHAANVQVIYNGVQTFQGLGWHLMPILECYSDEFKAQSNLLINDDYTYDYTTNCAENTGGRGVIASAAGAVKFTAHINTFIPNELLLNGCPGRPMSITINFDNNLYSVLSSSTTGTTCQITRAVLLYDEWETGSPDMTVGLAHFVSFPVDAKYTNANNIEVSSETRSDNGCPAFVFNHLSQNGALMSASTTSILQKPLPVESAQIDVNNITGAWNVTRKEDMFGRCKSVGYKHTMQDMLSAHAVNSTGAVLKIDLSKVSGCNISSHDIFRYHSNLTFNQFKKSGVYVPYTNVYLSTTYLYPSILHVSETETSFIYATDEMMGELGDYEPLDYLIVGAGFWDKIKKFGKKVITNAPGLIDKAQKIADVVAPNSGVSKGLNTASQISNILTGTSTSLF